MASEDEAEGSAPQDELPQPVSAGQGAGQEAQQQPDVAELAPDHPLLQRAQEALFQQLSATKLRLEEELREKKQALKARAEGQHAPGCCALALLLLLS